MRGPSPPPLSRVDLSARIGIECAGLRGAVLRPLEGVEVILLLHPQVTAVRAVDAESTPVTMGSGTEAQEAGQAVLGRVEVGRLNVCHAVTLPSEGA
jgi:hypothetical protein